MAGHDPPYGVAERLMDAPGSIVDIPTTRATSGYRWYVLAVLVAVYALSLVDRQIITILAGEIKRDLAIGDADLGLLYGTAFAVFYAVFGIPLGRLADGWMRTRLLALGLAGWSLMTMLSGFAGSFAQLAIARVGVGVGEASANPAAYSLLSDYFSKDKRATALAIYSCGVSIGMGASLWVGGTMVGYWDGAFAAGAAPFGLKGWQAAFVVVGLPGLAFAALVATMREPRRGGADALTAPPARFRWSSWLPELGAVLPPFTLLHLASLKPSRREWRLHAAGLLGIVATAVALVSAAHALLPVARRKVLFQFGSLEITSHVLQWTAIGLGAYCVFSWVQSLRLRDRPTYTLIWGTPALIGLIGATALNMLITYGTTAWAPFYAVQKFAVPLPEIGLKLGSCSVLAGIVGTSTGGVIADAWRRRNPRGRLYMAFISMSSLLPITLLLLQMPTVDAFVGCYALLSMAITMWLGAVASTTQDLVMPRMRGTSAATLALGMTMVGLGCGPYLAGLVSDVSGSLRLGMLAVQLATPLVWIGLIVAIRGLENAEATLLQRARAAGERT